MNRSWLSAGAFVGGIALFVFSAFGFGLPASHLHTVLRLAALAAGLALLLLALAGMNVLTILPLIAGMVALFRRALASLALLATALLVVVAYVFFASLGTWTSLPPTMNYYDRLAQAFSAGHLYLRESPDPALLALPDPYDPEARSGIRGLVANQPGTIWDMSVYNGRVYPYWGPAPALILAAAARFLPLHVGDQQLTLAFLLGAFIFEALIIIRLWRRFFADLPLWTTLAALLVAGLINPVPWLLFSPRIYEAAIAAGQFFLLAGSFAALAALDHRSSSAWNLVWAALLWVAAVASRATLAVAVAYLALAVLVALLARGAEGADMSSRWRRLALFVIPMLSGAALLAWYNFARFGSIFEFGFRYAITMLDQNRYHNMLFSPAYLRENAYLYLLNPPSLDALFPFVRPVWNQASIVQFNQQGPGIYNAERMVGMLYAAPFLLFSLVAPALALVDVFKRPSPAVAGDQEDDVSPPFLSALVLVVAGLAVLELLVVFLVYYSTMRYIMDAVPALVVLSVLGFWQGYRRARTHALPAIAYIVVAVALVVITISMGFLVGFSSDVARLKAFNPSLLTHLRLFFVSLARRLGG